MSVLLEYGFVLPDVLGGDSLPGLSPLPPWQHYPTVHPPTTLSYGTPPHQKPEKQ